jgi:hypothetical protein
VTFPVRSQYSSGLILLSFSALRFKSVAASRLVGGDGRLHRRRECLPTTADLTHGSFGGLLLLARHVDTLLGVSDPAKCLLA